MVTQMASLGMTQRLKTQKMAREEKRREEERSKQENRQLSTFLPTYSSIAQLLFSNHHHHLLYTDHLMMCIVVAESSFLTSSLILLNLLLLSFNALRGVMHTYHTHTHTHTPVDKGVHQWNVALHIYWLEMAACNGNTFYSWSLQGKNQKMSVAIFTATPLWATLLLFTSTSQLLQCWVSSQSVRSRHQHTNYGLNMLNSSGAKSKTVTFKDWTPRTLSLTTAIPSWA